MTSEAKTERAAERGYNPWSYYFADSIAAEAADFSVRRRIEFMESSHTRAVWVKQTAGPNYVEITVSGSCHDADIDDAVSSQFSFYLHADGPDGMDDHEKRRALAEIGRRYPGKTPNHMTAKRNAARSLGMPRFDFS